MSQGGAEEEAARRRTSASFDPFATARALGEIQAEGLRAAGALVERLVHLVDGPVRADGATGTAEPPLPNSPADSQAATDAWFTMWNELFERTTRALGAIGGGPPIVPEDGARSLTLDGRRPPVTNAVTVSVPVGGSACAEVWLHNGTAEDLGPLTPTCGPLVAIDGTLLGPAVEIDPASIELLPRRSSRALQLTVSAGADATIGPHRGTLQVAGAPDLWLAVEVVVEDPA
jgi:hypothetical protein